MLFWIFIGLMLALLLLAIVAKPAASPAKQRRIVPVPAPDGEDPLDLLDRDAPEALARYGTPETAAWLEAQGRGDELRGLGYRGGDR